MSFRRHRPPPRLGAEHRTHVTMPLQRIETGAMAVGPVVVAGSEDERMLELLKHVDSVNEYTIGAGK